MEFLVTDQALICLAKGCSELNLINITSEKITDVGMVAIANACKNLQILIIHSSKLVKFQVKKLITRRMLH